MDFTSLTTGMTAGTAAGAVAGAGESSVIVISSSNNFGGVCLLATGMGLLTLLLLELSEASTRGKPLAAADELSEDEVEGGSSLGGDARNAANISLSCGFLWLVIMGRGCAFVRVAASTTCGSDGCALIRDGATIGGSFCKDASEEESDCGISIRCGMDPVV